MICNMADAGWRGKSNFVDDLSALSSVKVKDFTSDLRDECCTGIAIFAACNGLMDLTM